MYDSTTNAGSWTGATVLSDEECWRCLRSAQVGRVAVTVGTTPDIFPVNYCVHGNDIVIRTEAGTKLAAGTLMPMIAFEIDEVDPANHRGWSVVVKGRGREPSGLDEIVSLDELDLEPWADRPASRWLIITPMDVTGRAVGRNRSV
jgi:nitroimidazol reductase NimA-like FMN-containing flavoprotein (pyridoxamine 5'-phosphate oxidase superfamily)